MKSDYPKIFEPITINRTTIKNRIAMTPMGTNYGETSGEMSNRHMNYYSLRAKGGVGLIILENANIEYPVGSNGTSQIRIDHDSFMPRYYQLVENLHKNGATVAIQINHAGASASSARTGMETVSSSNIPTKAGGETPRPMTKEEIMTTVKKYGEAAKRVQAIGFDAIEILCGHSYLMSQFISPYYNKRTDEFGGSVENRLRFPRMVLEEVRKNVGPWIKNIVSISAKERVPGGIVKEYPAIKPDELRTACRETLYFDKLPVFPFLQTVKIFRLVELNDMLQTIYIPAPAQTPLFIHQRLLFSRLQVITTNSEKIIHTRERILEYIP